MGKNLYYSSNNFSLKVDSTNKQFEILMILKIASVNTSDFPNTLEFLKKNFKSVLSTKCFNDDNLPFKEEVKSTEIGHLFEHILLEQLCLIKLDSGFDEAIFNGRTFWNWKKDPRGVFHILIDSKKKDLIFFSKALSNTIYLVDSLLSNTPKYNDEEIGDKVKSNFNFA